MIGEFIVWEDAALKGMKEALRRARQDRPAGECERDGGGLDGMRAPGPQQPQGENFFE